MSVIIKKVPDRLMGHIVKHENGAYCYVDSCYTLDHGYETMIFLYDKENARVADWGGVYSEWYETFEELEERHKYICNNLEEVLEE